jgi:hypothetical protein
MILKLLSAVAVVIGIVISINNITNICKKAARQLNVLKWIGKHLDGQIWQTYYLSFIYYVIYIPKIIYIIFNGLYKVL